MTNDQYPNDNEILRLLAKDDRQSISLLIDSHYKAVYKKVKSLTGNNQDTEDILQEVMLMIWERRKELKLTAPIRGFLMVVAHNTSINFLKVRHRRDSILTDVTSEWITEIPAASDASIQKQLQKDLHIAIRRLPIKTRIPYVLSRTFKMSNTQIAEQLQLSVKTVEKHMTKAIRLVHVWTLKQ